VLGYGGAELASGRTFLLGSVEYRFPIIRPVAGVIFADFGTDFGSGDTILGEPGPVRDKPGTGFGYGIGVRVKSPLGLIRGDLGINDQGDIRFEITTGHRF
jgi:outer membrane protein insertion porin family